MNEISVDDVVETDFSGTKTVHTVTATTVADNEGVKDCLVQVKPAVPENDIDDWFDEYWFKKVGVEVREIDTTSASPD